MGDASVILCTDDYTIYDDNNGYEGISSAASARWPRVRHSPFRVNRDDLPLLFDPVVEPYDGIPQFVFGHEPLNPLDTLYELRDGHVLVIIEHDSSMVKVVV